MASILLLANEGREKTRVLNATMTSQVVELKNCIFDMYVSWWYSIVCVMDWSTCSVKEKETLVLYKSPCSSVVSFVLNCVSSEFLFDLLEAREQ